ncbi:MAG: RNA polymerase-binding protein RbpA [Bowdeniella nasicola]|nr:RNA polymerase-binding protein RbpA [Bowdeniella nasicola]
MAERALRGMSLGSRSMESDIGVEFADRINVHYDCEDCGKVTTVTMFAQADLPKLWECACGKEAVLRDHERPEPTKPPKPQRTHWDMLLERRSREELQVLLDERLELLRAGKLRRRSA